jgi:ABC-type nitrate/sulfonate/bicarbonate transport system substrate-binding protein
MRAAAIGAALLVASPSLAQETQGNLEKFTFGLAVDSMVQQYPYHIAKELGFYAEEGLDVEFQDLGGSSNVVQQIIAGNVNAGSPSPGALLNAVAQGNDLRQVFSHQFKSVFTLATPADSGVKTVADLKGKTVGVSDMSGGEIPIVRAVLREAGLQEGVTVQLLPVGEGSALTVNAIQNGQIQAYSSNLFDVAAVEAAGIDMNVILPDSVANFPGNGVVVTAEVLEENREQIVGFLRALAKAIVWSEAHPQEAFEIAARLSPEQFEDEALAKASWEAAQTLKERPDALKDTPLGTHYMPGVETYHSFLRQGSEEEGALSKDVDLNTLMDTSLLAEVNEFDRAAVEQIEP